MSDWPLRVMIYGAGEAIDGTGALAPDIQVQLGHLAQFVTNLYVAGIAQLDSSNVPTLRYVLDPSGRQPVYQIPNVNVGNPDELVNFVKWSAAICPAQRSVLVLSGHGAAWQDNMVAQVLGGVATRALNAVPAVPGAIHHPRSLFGPAVSPTAAATRAVLIDGDNRDFLSNAALGAACSQISQALGGKIDALVFDACLMSAWEILQELSDSVSTVVASIDELSAAGIDISSSARQLSASGGAADANTIAATIANDFQPAAAFDSCVAINLASADWASAILALRQFCTAFLPWIQQDPSNADAARSALRTASTSLVRYSGGGLADIAAFANAIASIPGAPASAVDSVRQAASLVAACVLGRSAGSDYQAATGLSIFAPNSAMVYGSNRSDYVHLPFSSLTGWGAVLDVLYGFGDAFTRFVPGAGSPTSISATPGDAEFVISLDGLPLDANLTDQIEKAINRAVLDTLASIDLLADVSVIPPPQFAQTRGLLLPNGLRPILGLVVISNQDAQGALPSLATSAQITRSVGPTVVKSSGSEFRVLLRGLGLDEVTKGRIDAEIHSAVLQVIASIDHAPPGLQVQSPNEDPKTRSIFSGIGTILGLILRPPVLVPPPPEV